ncbi:MAG: hypothetical protein ACTHU1_02665 [Arachnia sp.]
MRRVQGLTRDIVILGAGTYGPVIGELAESCGYQVVRYLDDDPSRFGAVLEGVPVNGPIASGVEALPPGSAVAVAIGNNDARLRWLREGQDRGLEVPSLVSPSAVVSPTAVLAEGVYLHPGCHVWTHAKLGAGTILSPHATVAHHTKLGDSCFVSTGANVGASITVGGQSMFGIGSTISTGVKNVAHHTFVGAGATIIRDTEPFGVYVGSPGRLIKVNPPDRKTIR